MIREFFKDAPLVPCYDIDFSFNYTDKFDSYIEEIGQYQDLWGQGISEPLIEIRRIPLNKDTIFLMKKGTLKINLPNHTTTCIKFGSSEEEYNNIINSIKNGQKSYLTIVGTCTLNEYGGSTTPQIKLKDYEIETPLWDF